jgi:phage/plasmid-like protein (TIGR03299 family)
MSDQMVSTRSVPWMKLGELRDHPMTAAEAAEAGGLNFEVDKCDLFYATTTPPNPVTGISQHVVRPIPHRKAIVNRSNGAVMGIMAKDYPILQYGEAFDFMDQINPKFVAAGQLRSGRQGFMVVETDLLDGGPLGDVDPHKLYAVLRTSHDGTRAVEVSCMPLRERCMNQLTLRTFSRGARYRWAIKHTSSMKAKLAEAQDTLRRLGAYATVYRTHVDRLLHTKLHEETGRKIVRAALPERARREDQVEAIVDLWHTAETVGFDGTGWGLLNAVSEYFDHRRQGGSPESRFVGALQGVTHRTINHVTGDLLALTS